jgi:hypothetical protein
MTALKLIIAEAKKIRKKYPKKEWKDCVKQASAIYSSKHKTKKVGAIKKAAKKKVAKKSNGYHKDTKSHNVNIRVVSGIEKKSGMNKKISGWKKGKTKFVEKGEKPPKKNGVRVTRKKGEFSKFRSISGVPGSTGVKRLTQVVKNGTPLEKKVASIIKSKYTGSGYDNLEGLFKEILYNGLQSGIISELIYYSDTLAFYKRYKKNIQALLSNTMNDLGEYNPANIFGKNWDTEDPLAQDTTNQNLLAWFGFEETARDIAYRLGYEL